MKEQEFDADHEKSIQSGEVLVTDGQGVGETDNSDRVVGCEADDDLRHDQEVGGAFTG